MSFFFALIACFRVAGLATTLILKYVNIYITQIFWKCINWEDVMSYEQEN